MEELREVLREGIHQRHLSIHDLVLALQLFSLDVLKLQELPLQQLPSLVGLEDDLVVEVVDVIENGGLSF